MPASTKNRFLLLYGSQTGQAKAISEEIEERAESEGLFADICCLSQTEKKFSIEKEKCVVIVISTTGEGEPPETAAKFVRRLKKKTLPDDYLSKLNYTLLGLGDSNYTNFCNCGKSLDRRLEELGGKHIYPVGLADDAVGLEIVVEPWIDGLWSQLRDFLNISSDNKATVKEWDCIDVGQLQQTSEGNVESEQLNSEMYESQEKTGIMDSVDVASSKMAVLSVGDVRTDVSQEDTVITHDSSSAVDAGSGGIGDEESRTESVKGFRDVLDCVEIDSPSLGKSASPLSESALTLPALPPSYLKCTFMQEKTEDLPTAFQNDCAFPSAASAVTMASVESAKILTREDSVKRTLFLRLSVQDDRLQYEPGDAVSVVCQNDPEEVKMLLDRLELSSMADCRLEVGVVTDTKKKNPRVPQHIPPINTLRNVLMTCLDIRDQPKKALLRCFVECTADEREKRRLQELCSRQGAEDYSVFIRESRLSLLDILYAFPSCHPPVERFLEHLPRLQPRPYSVCSCTKLHPGKIDIAFNIVEIPADNRRTYRRKGVCTGWLDSLTREIQCDHENDTQSAESNPIQIPVFARTNQHFQSPESLTTPMILIGPGTGVSPFIGFLQHRTWQKSQSEEQPGEAVLFYGCRHEKRDFLFRKELEDFKKTGILSQLFVSYSRDEQSEDAPRYVQDSLRKQGELILDLIEAKGAVVYVCGDARNMAKDVNKAFVDVLQKCKGLKESDAVDYMMRMRIHKTYLEDVWT